MTTAHLDPTRTVTVPALPAARARSATGAVHLRAALLAIAGSIVAIGIVALSLLVVPVAVLVVFGPALLAAF